MDNEIYIVKKQGGETLSYICFKIFGNDAPNFWTELLSINPGISENGDIIKQGAEIRIPQKTEKISKQRVKIWD